MRETAKAGLAPLEADDVRDYLLTHPDFLVNNADLLSVLTPPRYRARNIIDVELPTVTETPSLRGSIDDHSLGVFQEHLYRQSRMNVAACSLLEAPSYKAMLRTIEQDFPILLDHEAVEIMTEIGGEPLPGIRQVGKGFVDEWLPDRDVMVEDDIHGVPQIFDERGRLVRSQALVRLSISREVNVGMLAFGHRDADYYQGALANEQVLHMAALIEVSVRRWLDLPV